jgi:diaminopimelate epimerase
MATINEVPFVKGHGTGNDFVVIPDLDGTRGISAGQVRFLCDRHAGIGADGVLRVVRTEHAGEAVPGIESCEFFMDYRNADGSLAEMCGNGARVFVRYLKAAGHITGSEVVIGTRAGAVTAAIHEDQSITIDMGAATPTGPAEGVTVSANGREWQGAGVLMPNPHAVVFVDDLADAGDLLAAPGIVPSTAFPEGVNVEFVVVQGPGHVAMRVHERGVGETRSCGTGACAVAWVVGQRWPIGAGGEDAHARESNSIRVDVPGGTLRVTETGDGHLLLTGPADLVARGTVLLPVAVPVDRQ